MSHIRQTGPRVKEQHACEGTAASTCSALICFLFSEQLHRGCRPAPAFRAFHRTRPLKNKMLCHNTRTARRLGNTLARVIHCIPPRSPSASSLHQNALIQRRLAEMPFSHTRCLDKHVFFTPGGAVFWQLRRRMFAQTSLPQLGWSLQSNVCIPQA